MRDSMITEIKNQTFRDATIEVDEKRFIDCQFFNCTLWYKGGNYGWERTVFHPGCVWKFDGCALRTVGLLKSLNFITIPIADHSASQLN
jgi:hypothetical protein